MTTSNTSGLQDGVVNLSEAAKQWMRRILAKSIKCKNREYYHECAKRNIPWRIKGATSYAKICGLFAMLLPEGGGGST